MVAGTVWLITGASSGFGRSIAEAALAAGDTVVATARNQEKLDDLIAVQPERVFAPQLDVTDTARIDAVVDEVLRRFGSIDVLVNNAGRGHVGAVKVLIVEPGSFRTGLLGGAMTQSVAISGYEPTAGATRATLSSSDGNQPGDPAKCAAAILTALAAEVTPLRLPLGNDAADATSAQLEQAREEFLAWERVARSTDFDD